MRFRLGRADVWGRSAIIFASVLLVSACGRKASPTPPEFLAPVAVLTLIGQSEPSGISLQWLAPEKTVAGKKHAGLKQFHVYRRAIDSDPDFSELAEVATAERPDSNTVFQYRDQQTEAGKAYEYYVTVTDMRGDESTPGNIVRLTPQS